VVGRLVVENFIAIIRPSWRPSYI